MTAKWGKKKNEIVGGALPAQKPERIANTLDTVLVAESKVDRTTNLKHFARNFAAKKRNLYSAGAVLLVGVVLLLGAVFGGSDPQPESISSGPKCTYQTLATAKKNFAPKRFNQLEKQAKEIEQIPGYDQDVNCLYVVTMYYLNAGNAAKSREFYGKLAAFYVPDEGYATVLRDVALEPEQIKAKVEFLEKQAQTVDETAKRYQGIKIDPKTGGPVR